MTTLRQFLIAQSSLPQGNTVRNHLDNPAAIGETTFTINNEESLDFALGEALTSIHQHAHFTLDHTQAMTMSNSASFALGA